MIHVMFDVDGTLVDSYEFDEVCYLAAVESVLGERINTNWSRYPHISDTGILKYALESHGRENELNELLPRVKSAFIRQIEHHLAKAPAQEISGAAHFMSCLRQRPEVKISIATGGWEETAIRKLQSAEIDVDGVPMASSNDHFSRTQIMRASAKRLGEYDFKRRIYFGDAQWDQRACEQLGYEFVAIGSNLDHQPRFDDYNRINELIDLITA